MEDMRLQDSIVGSGDMNMVGTPPDSGEFLVEDVPGVDIVVRMEVKVEMEQTPSADSLFSEATDEDQLINKGFGRDSFDEDLDEMMALEDSE